MRKLDAGRRRVREFADVVRSSNRHTGLHGKSRTTLSFAALLAALTLSTWSFVQLESGRSELIEVHDRVHRLQARVTHLREQLVLAEADMRLAAAIGDSNTEAARPIRQAVYEITALLALADTKKCLPESDFLQLGNVRNALMSTSAQTLKAAGAKVPLSAVDAVNAAVRDIHPNILDAPPAQTKIAVVEAECFMSRLLFCFSLIAALGSIASIHWRHQRERRQWMELQAFVALFSHMARTCFASLRLTIGGFKAGRSPDPDIAEAAGDAVIDLEVAANELLRQVYRKENSPLKPAGLIIGQLAQGGPSPAISVMFDARAAAIGVPADQFRALIGELLANATTAVRDKTSPRILVHGQIRDRLIVPGYPKVLIIDVVDNGCGMSPEIVRQATTPFFSTSGGAHIGLGLTSCKRMAQALAGRLSIKSRPGIGTTVRVELPIDTPIHHTLMNH